MKYYRRSYGKKNRGRYTNYLGWGGPQIRLDFDGEPHKSYYGVDTSRSSTSDLDYMEVSNLICKTCWEF